MNRRQFVAGALAAGAGIGVVEQTARAQLKEHGIVGDGRTDDSEALQRAVDAEQGAVYLPRGVYRLTRPVVVDLASTGWMSVIGTGTAQLVMEGAGPAIHVIGTHEGTAGPSSVTDQVWARERLPLVTGIEILGRHAEAVGVRLEKTMMASLTDLLIRRCLIGIDFHERNRNVVVSHCHLYHNLGIGLRFHEVNLHQAIVADSHISYNAVAGIMLIGGNMRNFQIVGNDIEYNYDTRREGSADVLIDMRPEGGSFREGTLVGNTIQARPSPGGANVRMLGGDDLRTGGLFAITGNLIGNQTDTIHLADCRGVTVSGNSLYSAVERTLHLERCANIVAGDNTIDWNPVRAGKGFSDGIRIEDCDGVILSDTIIENCFRGTPEAGGAVEIHRSRDVSVHNCQVLDPRHRGIVLTDAVRCRVSGCTVIDRREEPSMRASIQVSGSGQDNVVENNMVSPGSLELDEGATHVRGNVEVNPKGLR